MSKKLIITEKPSVARDFARVLKVSGNRQGYIENEEYVISWCYGHLVEMVYPEEYDEKYAKWRLDDLPFLPREYKYGVIKSSKDQYNIVNGLLHREDVDTVYWAGDSGKEGQTIEENIRRYGGVRSGMNELRVWIDSQTDDEILRGIREAKPMSDYERLGKSGIMRTIEDYSLGINFSRALSVKYGKLVNDAAATASYTAIAIGRVMTCVLGMVVRREREIRNFTETPFFRIIGAFSDAGFEAEWKAVAGSRYLDSPLLYKENGFKKKESAEAFIDALKGKEARIEKSDVGTTRKKAPLLYNLAELQADCSRLFKISPAKTLEVIQELYEKKFTTYPRTDARVLTTAIAKEITKNVRGLLNHPEMSPYAKKIMDEKLYAGIEKSSYTDDSKVTDHYAVIPTGHTNGIASLPTLHKSVYDLICRRFLSIFYPPAEYQYAKMQFDVDGEMFFASAKVLRKPGYLEVAGEGSKENDDGVEVTSGKEFLLFASQVQKGDPVSIKGYEIREGKTSPPKRYTSGTLVLAMENAGNLIEDDQLREQIKKSGIGTSATRGEIIEKLVRIRYLNQNAKTQVITPENLGEMVYEVVELSVPSLLNPEMTANWEKGLDGIINGTVDDAVYRTKLEDYIRRETGKMIQNDLSSQLAAKISAFAGKDAKGPAARKPMGVFCPVCGGELTTTPFGYGCSNYWKEDIKCKFNVGKIAGRELSEEELKDLITKGKTGVLEGFTGKNKKPFKASLVLKKEEDGKVSVGFDFADVGPDYLADVVCPDCGGRIIRKAAGYGCEKFDSDNPESCRFFVGKIAQKMLTQTNVTELLKNGSTGTIRGFKGKSGKKFDACLVLKKNEEGKTVVSFDFDNVEAKVIKNVVCPVCGGEVVKTPFGYGCKNYNRENPEAGCRFHIGTISGVKLTEAQLKELLNQGITSTISGFHSKAGALFEAKLSLAKDESGKVTGCRFVFEDEDEVLQGIVCPKCSGSIIKGHFGYRCSNYSKEEGGCSFYVGKIASVFLAKEQFCKLIQEGITDEIDGFTSKAGKLFSAKLKLDEEKKIVFAFGREN